MGRHGKNMASLTGFTRKRKMKRRAFTLIEVLVIVIIAGILASIAIPSYQNFMEEQKARVCETNLKTLQQALDIYAIDHDTMPASLSELPDETINKAFARILQEKGSWRIKLAYFMVDFNQRHLAYAAPFLNQLARGNMMILTCPKNSKGGVSYGVNAALAQMSCRQYREISSEVGLIGDCDNLVFNSNQDLAQRHVCYTNIFNKESYAQVVSKSQEVSGYPYQPPYLSKYKKKQPPGQLKQSVTNYPY